MAQGTRQGLTAVFLCALPESLLWPHSPEPLPRLATQSAFGFFLYHLLCGVPDSRGLRQDRIRDINRAVSEPERQQHLRQGAASCSLPARSFPASRTFYSDWSAPRRVCDGETKVKAQRGREWKTTQQDVWL